MTTYKPSKKSVIDFIITLPILFTFTGIFLYENAVKNIQALILISCTLSLLTYGYSHVRTQIKENKLILIVLSLAIYGIIQSILHGYSNGLIKMYLSIFIYLTVIPIRNIQSIYKNLLFYVLLATICSISFYFHQEETLNKDRGSWDIGVLHYTVLSAWLTCFAVHALLSTKIRSRQLLSVFIIFANAFIIISMQARGTYLALIITILLFLSYLAYKKSKVILFAAIMTMLVLLSSIGHIPVFEQRMAQTKNEINSISNGNLNTSIGYRIQVWEAACYIIPTAPFFGVGDKHRDMKSTLANQGIISNVAANFRHYHNDYINTLVKNGTVGLILMISLLTYPIRAFIKNKSFNDLPLLFLFSIYGITALTNVPFTSLQLNIFFLIVTWIYLSNVDKEIIVGNKIKHI
ncbi:O-antigen ligase family protein [Vibrio scophthalmi]|uniref:O-antigen ligase family protein n=1 Tax=Vibrio scophthalmi TaxID=45658 RepID=UPI002283FB87|nr:O-antigen ligase family protein [Vibrio scophthalmi]MCY9804058.1 O-antigen ligase family protein [Vibrio scophthalmi]